MKDSLNRFRSTGVVPVVVLDDAKDAIPTARALLAGGVDAKNLKEYLEAPFVHAVGGSWLCPKKEIAAGNFDAVTALCREASEIVREVRG